MWFVLLPSRAHCPLSLREESMNSFFLPFSFLFTKYPCCWAPLANQRLGITQRLDTQVRMRATVNASSIFYLNFSSLTWLRYRKPAGVGHTVVDRVSQLMDTLCLGKGGSKVWFWVDPQRQGPGEWRHGTRTPFRVAQSPRPLWSNTYQKWTLVTSI